MKTILIVDYGMANLRSVQKAFEKVGHEAKISGDPNRIAEADKVVLPGVGAFRDAIARLHEAGLATPIRASRAARQTVLRHLPRHATAVHAQPRGRRTRGLNCSRRSGSLRRRAGPQGAAHGLEQAGVSRRAPAGRPRRPVGLLRPLLLRRAARSAMTAAKADYPTPFTAAIWKRTSSPRSSIRKRASARPGDAATLRGMEVRKPICPKWICPRN